MQLLQKLSLYSLVASSSLLLVILWPLSKAQAHCKVWHPHHCSLPDLDPTRGIPGSKIFAENAWGEAGGAAYPAAASIMRGRNGGSQGLDEFQKRNLRPSFGNLVDQVVVIYNARMMDQWSAFGKSINLSGVDSAGQTYCNRIYIRDSYKPNDVQQVRLLAHEMAHSRQCRDLGGEGKFGFHYFREYKRAGLSYANNKLEKEAEDFASNVAITEKIERCRFGGVISNDTNCLLTTLPVLQSGVRYWLDTDPRWPGVYYWTDNKGVCAHGGVVSNDTNCLLTTLPALQSGVRYWLDTDPQWPGVYYKD